jgi:hypothetical protein
MFKNRITGAYSQKSLKILSRERFLTKWFQKNVSDFATQITIQIALTDLTHFRFLQLSENTKKKLLTSVDAVPFE